MERCQQRLIFIVYSMFVELIYCGSVLEDSAKLIKEGINSGSTIHVFDKNEKQENEPIALTEDIIANASGAYRSVCFRCPGFNFPVS